MNIVGGLSFVNSIADDATTELLGAFDVATAEINGVVYVYVTGAADDGVQVFSMAGDGTLSPVDAVEDNAALGLEGAGPLSVVEVDGQSFLAVGSILEEAVTMYRIEDSGVGSDGALVLVESYSTLLPSGIALSGGDFIETVDAPGGPYLVTRAAVGDGLTVLRVTATGELELADLELNADDPATNLDQLSATTSATVAGVTYVITGTKNSPDGFSVFRLEADGTLTNTDNVTPGGALFIDTMTTVTIGGQEALVATDLTGDRVFVYQINPGGTLTLASTFDASVGPDGVPFDLKGLTPLGIADAPIFLATGDDDRLFVLGVDPSGTISVLQSVQDATFLEGAVTTGIGANPGGNAVAVREIDGRVFVTVAATEGDRVSVYEIGANDDVLVGTSDADLIIGFSGDDDLIGRGGDDELIGNAGEDVLSGRRGSDVLSGGEDIDVLVGGRGDDLLEGGADADVLVGGAGSDTASYAGSDGRVRVDLLGSLTTGADATGDVFVSIENVQGSAFNDQIRGDNGDNTLSGGAGNDRLIGSGGSDLLEGNAGRDRLIGGGQSDELRGGGDRDRLEGGGGADILTGGAAGDLFIFVGSFGDDTITDFETGSDRIDLTAIAEITNTAELAARATTIAGDTLILLDSGSESITIEGVTLGDLSASDFIFT